MSEKLGHDLSPSGWFSAASTATPRVWLKGAIGNYSFDNRQLWRVSNWQISSGDSIMNNYYLLVGHSC